MAATTQREKVESRFPDPTDGDRMSVPIVSSPKRINCLPKQLLDAHFPTLPIPSRTSVPKRYEDTKPVIVQNFTHRRILGIGEEINRSYREEAEKGRIQAIEEAISETWDKAHAIKEQAIAAVVEKAQIAQEKAVRKVQRSKDRAIKEEALKVESAMQEKMREALEEQRKQAEIKLTQEVAKVREKGVKDLEEAVAVAREEEKKIAVQQREEMKRNFEEKMASVIARMTMEKNHELAALESRKDIEKEKAVKEETKRNEQILMRELTKLRENNKLNVAKVEKQRDSIRHIIAEKEQEIVEIQRKREALYDELQIIQEDFQNFIDKHPLFDSGQTDYLLPDLKANPKIICPYQTKADC